MSGTSTTSPSTTYDYVLTVLWPTIGGWDCDGNTGLIDLAPGWRRSQVRDRLIDQLCQQRGIPRGEVRILAFTLHPDHSHE